jgi:hypothetical protein
MKYPIRNITVAIILPAFFYFSSGMIHLPGLMINQEDVCHTQKACTCCSSGEGACACIKAENFKISFNLPCSHPGFTEKDATPDPTIFRLIENTRVFFTISSFTIDIITKGYPIITNELLKPPLPA